MTTAELANLVLSDGACGALRSDIFKVLLLEAEPVAVPSSAPSSEPPRFDVEAWEGEDRVVTMNGKPIGQSLSVRDAAVIKRWLPTAISELRAAAPSAAARAPHPDTPQSGKEIDLLFRENVSDPWDFKR